MASSPCSPTEATFMSGRARQNTVSTIASTSSTESDVWSSPASLSPSTPASSVFSSGSFKNRVRSISNASAFALWEPSSALIEESHQEDIQDERPSSPSYFDQRSPSSPASPDLSHPGTPISGTSTPSRSRNASVLAFTSITSQSEVNLSARPSNKSRSLLSLTKPFKNRKRATSLLSNPPDTAEISEQASSSSSPTASRNSSSTDLPRSRSRPKLFQRMLSASRRSSQVDLSQAEEPDAVFLELPPRRNFAPRGESWTLGSAPVRPAIGRHQSAPLQSLVLAPVTPELPAPTPANLFESLLPREVQIRIFRTLFELLAAREVANDRWSGYAGAVRQLIRLTRVSHSWASLVLDGQLWNTLSMQMMGPNSLSMAGLLKVVDSAGPFLRTLNLKGLQELDDRVLFALGEACSRTWSKRTNLAHLNLNACRLVTSASLDALISRSPLLQHVSLCGLPGVNDDILSVLYKTSLSLKTLNVARCRSLSGQALSTPHHPLLLKLSASGIQDIDPEALGGLGRSFPNLLALDISDNETVTDLGLQRFLQPFDSGSGKRTTKLRSLNVSKCTALSDNAFFELVGTVPELECLEAAEIGSRIRDLGLAALLRTTPKLKKLDLEANAELTDEFLRCLWKCPDLEHVNLSYAVHLSDSGLCRFIRHADNLRILELDNTRITDAVPREFIKTMRVRKTEGAELNIVDCRGLSRSLLNDLRYYRPRRGYTGWQWSAQKYSDHPRLHEFTEGRVVLKSFTTWALLDSVQNGLPAEPTPRPSLRRMFPSEERSSSSCIIS